LQDWIRDVFDLPPLPEAEPEEVELPAPETVASSEDGKRRGTGDEGRNGWQMANSDGKKNQSPIASRNSPTHWA